MIILGLILPQEVIIKDTNEKYKYEKMGYKIVYKYDEHKKKFIIPKDFGLKVHVLDLPKKSGKKVKVQCDCCGEILTTQYTTYNKHKKEDGKYYCRTCSVHEAMLNSHVNSYSQQEIEDVKKLILKELYDYINKNNMVPLRTEFDTCKDLHTYERYKFYFGEDTDIIDWVNMCGAKITKEMRIKLKVETKENVIESIKEKQSKIDRPLMYDDFRKNNIYNGEVSIPLIKKYFGTINNMKKELGIELCQNTYGYKHIFEDNEIATSKFEYEMSVQLRNKGLKYEKDYFRNFKYKDIDETYVGNMNCDYMINFNNMTFYIEIGGMMKNYLKNYHEDIPIPLERAEKYRLDLKAKEKILKKNNCQYLIYVPSDNHYQEEIEQIINNIFN